MNFYKQKLKYKLKLITKHLSSKEIFSGLKMKFSIFKDQKHTDEILYSMVKKNGKQSRQEH